MRVSFVGNSGNTEKIENNSSFTRLKEPTNNTFAKEQHKFHFILFLSR